MRVELLPVIFWKFEMIKSFKNLRNNYFKKFLTTFDWRALKRYIRIYLHVLCKCCDDKCVLKNCAHYFSNALNDFSGNCIINSLYNFIFLKWFNFKFWESFESFENSCSVFLFQISNGVDSLEKLFHFMSKQ